MTSSAAFEEPQQRLKGKCIRELMGREDAQHFTFHIIVHLHIRMPSNHSSQQCRSQNLKLHGGCYAKSMLVTVIKIAKVLHKDRMILVDIFLCRRINLRKLSSLAMHSVNSPWC